MKTLIKRGKIITAEKTFIGDILIEDEKIAAVEPEIIQYADEVIDAGGMMVMPGGVDPHVHLSLPFPGTISSDDHYTGMKAAAFGGTTTVLDFANQAVASPIESFKIWQEKAEPNAAVDYGIHQNFTIFSPEALAEIAKLPEIGVTTIKMFTAYNGRMRLYDSAMFQAMRVAKDNGLLSMVHAENGDLIELLVAEALAAGHTEPVWHARTRPASGAVAAALNTFALSHAAGDAPVYLVHMNTAGEVDMLKYAKDQGYRVFGETCPHYLMFTASELEREDGAKFIFSPPLRSPEDNDGLWHGLSDDIIDTVGTDHCPFLYDGTKAIMYDGEPYQNPGKELGRDDFSKTPNGAPGIEDRLPVMWTEAVLGGKISENRFVELMSTNPAKIFGIYPQKGCLEPGSDADIAIWDPEKEVNYGVKVAKHRTDYNLYEGWRLKGFPVKVFLRGKMIVDNGEWHGTRGGGRFLKRKKFEL